VETDREFERRRDPWGYTTIYGRERLHREAGILDGVRRGARFNKALEVGCAEGVFTELLVRRCEFLLAVDICTIALARARERCRESKHVKFEEWNLLCDPLPGTFDLIVVEDVLDYIGRPWILHTVREKLVDGLRPGGYLLVGNVRQNEVLERAWWGRRLIRGGRWINAFMSQHPALSVVATATVECGGAANLEVLLRKVI
jgi:SAM-dependent methyltransferase